MTTFLLSETLVESAGMREMKILQTLKDLQKSLHRRVDISTSPTFESALLVGFRLVSFAEALLLVSEQLYVLWPAHDAHVHTSTNTLPTALQESFM